MSSRCTPDGMVMVMLMMQGWLMTRGSFGSCGRAIKPFVLSAMPASQRGGHELRLATSMPSRQRVNTRDAYSRVSTRPYIDAATGLRLRWSDKKRRPEVSCRNFRMGDCSRHSELHGSAEEPARTAAVPEQKCRDCGEVGGTSVFGEAGSDHRERILKLSRLGRRARA